jgi:hypothetical protein
MLGIVVRSWETVVRCCFSRLGAASPVDTAKWLKGRKSGFSAGARQAWLLKALHPE